MPLDPNRISAGPMSKTRARVLYALLEERMPVARVIEAGIASHTTVYEIADELRAKGLLAKIHGDAWVK